jgi:hypothetical protein
MSTEQRFSLGDRVRWQSQAHGSHKVKEGEIVEIVPAGYRPDKVFYQLHRGAGCGMPRDHASFVVLVGKKPYWPRVAALHKVTR